jgi:hypothetical protein
MFIKSLSTSHNSLKIVIQKMPLKTFSMSTYIMTQPRCKLRKVQTPKKKWLHNLQRSIFQIDHDPTKV